LDASGFGSFDIPGTSLFVGLAVGFSINPITGELGDDRVVVCRLLSIQLRKSWICSFSCVGRYWILAKQDSK
jgi:hypothetical protein